MQTYATTSNGYATGRMGFFIPRNVYLDKYIARSETHRFSSYLSQKELKSLILWETYQYALFANETHEEVKMTPTRAPKKRS